MSDRCPIKQHYINAVKRIVIIVGIFIVFAFAVEACMTPEVIY